MPRPPVGLPSQEHDPSEVANSIEVIAETITGTVQRSMSARVDLAAEMVRNPTKSQILAFCPSTQPLCTGGVPGLYSSVTTRLRRPVERCVLRFGATN
jgi:hypothetical protein